jgi:lipopolysaccharide export LptBFGC system permease protein LptF
LISIFSKFIDIQILVGLIVCVVFRMWMENVLRHCISLYLFFICLLFFWNSTSFILSNVIRCFYQKKNGLCRNFLHLSIF